MTIRDRLARRLVFFRSPRVSPRPQRVRRRWLRWLVIALLTPILLLFAVLLSAPLWINQDRVKHEVIQIVGNATGGKVQFDRIDLHFLPLPGAELSGVRFSLPGTLEVEAQSAAVNIRLLPLLLGNVYPHGVRIIAPRVRVQLDEPKPSPPTPPQPFSLKDAETSVRSVLEQIEAAVPGLAAEIDEGQVELRIGQRPPLLVERLDVHADVTASSIAAKVSFRSNVFEQFDAELRATSKDLSGEGKVEVADVRVPALGPILGIPEGWPVQEASVNAKLSWRMHGLTDAQADATVTAAKVALQFGKGHLEFLAPAIELAAQTKGANAELTLRRLAVESPRLAVRATLSKTEPGGYVLESETNGVELSDLQAVANGLAPVVPWLQPLPVILASGTVTTAKFRTQAASLADLFDLQAMHISGAVDNADLSIPAFYNLKPHRVSAVASLEQGILHVQNAQAKLTKSNARDGSLVVDLNADVPPLHADFTVAADLSEAFALIKLILSDAQSQQQLNQVSQLQGSALARIILGGDTNNVTVRVEASGIQASARYAPVPFPIRITRGALTFTGDAFSVQGLDGSIGLSSFTGVSARLDLNAPTLLSAQQGSVSLALEELFHWAVAQPQLAKQLEGVKTVSGSLAVSVSALEMPLSFPDRLRFHAAATPEKIVIDAPRYGPPARFDGGVIDVSEQSVSANGVDASVLDAQLKLSGRTDGYRQGIGSVKVGASGTVGLEALKWVYARAGITEELRLRGALLVSRASADWSTSSGVATQGSVNVAGGPVIGFSVHTTAKGMEVETLTVRDEASDATLRARLDGTRFRAGFKGRIAGSSIKHLFVDPPLSVGQLQGDITVEGDWEHPEKTTGSGSVQATGIQLPREFSVPVTVDELRLEAQNTQLLVKSATVSSGQSRVEVSGTIAYPADMFTIDADIRGDTMVVPVSSPQTTGAAEPDTRETGSAKVAQFLNKVWYLPARGQVRVDVAHFQVGRREISPLVGIASLQGTTLDLRLQRASLCSLTLSGKFVARPDDVELNGKASARGAQVYNVIACMTGQRVQMTGTLNFDAEFSARGKLAGLLDTLKATYSITATNGHINKFDELDAVLKVVNLTQIIAGQIPDLDKQGMDYRSAWVKGTMEGHTYALEAAMNASAITLAAHGTVNDVTKAIDMTVLVAPFKTLDWIINKIPIVRNILGGTLLAVPVHVGGTFDNPQVVPLGARAVGARAGEILSNTLGLPKDFIQLGTPPATGAGQPATPPQPAAK